MIKNNRTKIVLQKIYAELLKEFGPQNWWPGETKIEIIVGAILTQNTNWGNVEKAIRNLKAEGVLSATALRDISLQRLAALIKPAGYFNVKARRLKNFIQFLFAEYQGNLEMMQREGLDLLRPKLLKVNGIGPETADSILLYALEKPVFVVDAYTKRFLYRHNLIAGPEDYHQVQELFMNQFDHDVALFNEYHALIVAVGKNYCKPKPICQQCPLSRIRYSLHSKCGTCHRALDRDRQKIDLKSRFACTKCR